MGHTSRSRRGPVPVWVCPHPLRGSRKRGGSTAETHTLRAGPWPRGGAGATAEVGSGGRSLPQRAPNAQTQAGRDTMWLRYSCKSRTSSTVPGAPTPSVTGPARTRRPLSLQAAPEQEPSPEPPPPPHRPGPQGAAWPIGGPFGGPGGWKRRLTEAAGEGPGRPLPAVPTGPGWTVLPRGLRAGCWGASVPLPLRKGRRRGGCSTCFLFGDPPVTLCSCRACSLRRGAGRSPLTTADAWPRTCAPEPRWGTTSSTSSGTTVTSGAGAPRDPGSLGTPRRPRESRTWPAGE